VRRLVRALRRLAPVLLTVPLTFGVPVVDDSTYTRVRVGGGGGQYTRVRTQEFASCEGTYKEVVESHDERFRDAGIEIERGFGNDIGIGIRGGYLDDARLFGANGDSTTLSSHGYTYVQPYFILDDDIGAFSFGVVRTSRPLMYAEESPLREYGGARYYPSLGLRVGPPGRLYGTFEFLNGLPLYSSGGYATAGLGTNIGGAGFWLGASFGTGLYERAGFLVRGAVPIGPHWTLGINARTGHERGFGGNVGYRIYHAP